MDDRERECKSKCEYHCQSITTNIIQNLNEYMKLDKEIRSLLMIPQDKINLNNELHNDYFQLIEDKERCIESCKRRCRDSDRADTIEPVDPALLQELNEILSDGDDDSKGGSMRHHSIHNKKRKKTKRLRRRRRSQGYKQRQSRKQHRSRRYKKTKPIS